MTPEEKTEIVRTAYESFTNEPWTKSGRQEHWENMVDEVNRRPHLTGADSMEEHVRKVYHQVMFGIKLTHPDVKPPKAERAAVSGIVTEVHAGPPDEPKDGASEVAEPMAKPHVTAKKAFEIPQDEATVKPVKSRKS